MVVDTQRAVVVPGDGVVARFPGVLCVARCSEPEALRRLLDYCAEVAGVAPGRRLARRLAGWLATDDAPDDLVFGTVSTTGGQLAVFLSGPIGIVVGEDVALSGVDSAAWTDRLLPMPSTPVVLALHGESTPADLLPDVVAGVGGTSLLDLRAGVVPGLGVVLGPDLHRSPLAPALPAAETADALARPESAGPDQEGAAAAEPQLEPEFTAGEWFGATLPDESPAQPAPSTSVPAASEPATAEPSTSEPVSAEPPSIEPPSIEPASAEPGTDGQRTGRHAVHLAKPASSWPQSEAAAAAHPEALAPAALDPATTDPERADPDPVAPGESLDEPAPAPEAAEVPPLAPRPVQVAEHGPASLPFGAPRTQDVRPSAAVVPTVSGNGNGSSDHGRPDHSQPDHSQPGHSSAGHGPSDHNSSGHGWSGNGQANHSLSGNGQSGDHSLSGNDQAGDSSSRHSQPGHAQSGDSSWGHSSSGNGQSGDGQPGDVRSGDGAPAAAHAAIGTTSPGRVDSAAGVDSWPGNVSGPAPQPPAPQPPAPQPPTVAPREDSTQALAFGAHPPLGTLVFDDGATYAVDAEYVVGRMPEADARVRAGDLRSIVVEDRSGSVSRVHAEIRLDGEEVLLADAGSRNGTFFAEPAQEAWVPLPPGHTRRLVPGTRVRMGSRTFVFEAPVPAAVRS